MFPYALLDIVLVLAVDRVEEMAADELYLNILVPAKEVKALRLHPIIVLIRDAHSARHNRLPVKPRRSCPGYSYYPNIMPPKHW